MRRPARLSSFQDVSLVQINEKTTQGGITRAGFRPGVSGNPGGRPKGLGRRVRELVGDDGDAIVQFMVAVMRDQRQRTRDRLEAARWLTDRGFGKATQQLDVEVDARPPWIDLDKFSDEELEVLRDLVEKGQPT